MDVAQAAPFIQSVTYEAGLLEYEDFPRTEEPVYILGTKYSALYELEDIKKDVTSRLWFTYRWGFAPIGGDGPTSDQGWGCMLRCGQMILAQALVTSHLGRDWRWYEGKNDRNYYEILKMFVDKKNSCYSIHQIANMGASEGKLIGQWFGPNTIAQVLKKLSVYDVWTNLKIHVALDNTVIVEDVLSLCKIPCSDCDQLAKDSPESSNSVNTSQTCGTCKQHRILSTNQKTDYSSQSGRPTIFDRVQQENLSTFSSGQRTSNLDSNRSSDYCGCYESGSHGNHKLNSDRPKSGDRVKCGGDVKNHWRPLLLIIPLRLGLNEINPLYYESLKKCFTLKHSVGIIGGKPNQAHWFIGVVGDELIYLDPHTRQPVEELGRDESYHCPYSCRMKLRNLDPSIALGFFFGSESDFHEFYCEAQHTICQDKSRIFEMHLKRPRHWPTFEESTTSVQTGACSSDYQLIDRQYDTDEEFELL